MTNKRRFLESRRPAKMGLHWWTVNLITALIPPLCLLAFFAVIERDIENEELEKFMSTVNSSIGYYGESYLEQPKQKSIRDTEIPPVTRTYFNPLTLQPYTGEEYHLPKESAFDNSLKQNTHMSTLESRLERLEKTLRNRERRHFALHFYRSICSIEEKVNKLQPIDQKKR